MSKVRVDTISTLDDQFHVDVLDLIALKDSSVPMTGNTGAVMIPKGTTVQRPAVIVDGLLRYNTDTNKFEGVQSGEWVNLQVV